MKIKSVIILLFLILVAGKGVKSQVDFHWSEEQEKNSTEKVEKIIHIENEGTYVYIKKDKSSFRVDFFSTDNTLQSSEDFSINGIITGVFKVGAKIAVFYTRYNGKTKEDELYYKNIKEKEGKEKLLLSNKEYGGFHNRYKLAVSPGCLKLVVLNEKPHREGKKESMVLTVFDENINKEREKNYLLTTIYSQKRKINVPVINDRGEVYVLKRTKVKNTNKYYVISYPVSSGVYLRELKLNYKPIIDANFTIIKSQDLVVAGTFSSPGSKRAEGVFVAKVNKDATLAFRKEYPFRLETMTAFISEKTLKREGMGLPNIRTKHLIETKTGGALILEHHSKNRNKKSGELEDIHKGIIVMHFNPKGDYLWDIPVLFHQKDTKDKGFWNSFVSYNDTVNNTIKILYNEVGYYDKKQDNNFGENTAIGARLVTINDQGEATIEPIKSLFKTSSKRLALYLKTHTASSQGLFLVAQPLERSAYFLGEVIFTE